MANRYTGLRVGAVLVALCAPGARAQAQNQQDLPPVVRYRQSIMSGFQAHTGALRVLMDDAMGHGGDVRQHATAIRDLSTMLNGLFPAGSGVEGSRAMAEIWQNRSDFDMKVTELQTAARALAAAADRGDAAATQSALGDVNGACRSCHTSYRARPAGRGGRGGRGG